MEKELMKALPAPAKQAIESVPAIEQLVAPPKENNVGRNVSIIVAIVAVAAIVKYRCKCKK